MGFDRGRIRENGNGHVAEKTAAERPDPYFR